MRRIVFIDIQEGMEASLAKVKWQMGKVIWFDEFSGEGEVRGPDGKDFFVHYSAIESEKKWKKLRADKEVKFTVSKDPKKQYITKVREL